MRTLAAAVTVLSILGSTSCILDTPPGDWRPNEGPIAGISLEEDGPAQVTQKLGKPQRKAVGWWRNSFHYDEQCPVWYYRGVGRVVFNFNSTRVIATESDKTEEARPL
jgi:hypothetical protein